MTRETVVHHYCPDCKSFTQPSLSQVHFCLRALGPGEKRQLSDYQPKKWNSTLQCWVLDTTRNSAYDGKYWDAKLGTWVYDPAHKAQKSENHEVSMTRAIADIGRKKAETIPDNIVTGKEYEVSSCEMPPKKVSSEPSKWVSTRPWTGVDRFKYPATWHKLIQMYYAQDWYQVGPYISDDEYRDRVLKGIYKPQVKVVKVESNLYTGPVNYGYYREWEGDE